MPLVLKNNIDQHTVLGLWKIAESEEALLASLQLKPHEWETINALGGEKRRLHWLSTRVLLRTLLATKEYIDCQIDEHGKPFLVDSDIHISLSHSFDYAAVLISHGKQVGVDIELIKPKISVIKHKFLSDEELNWPQMADNLNGLYVCWCAKEAIYKWHGKKGLAFKRDMCIQPFELGETGALTTLVALPTGNVEVKPHYFKTNDGYMLAYIVQ